MKKKDIEKLEKWGDYNDLVYDFIYVVPTRKKMGDYRIAYYIGKIGDETKIIDMYDCGTIFLDTEGIKYFMLNWDFEDIYGGIKFWRNGGKLKYEYGGRIVPLNK